MRGKPPTPLPDIATLKAAYYRKGSVRAAARALHVAQWRVSQALFEAGITTQPGWRPKRKPNQAPQPVCACVDCKNATAMRCQFIRATRDAAADALTRLAATYITKEQKYRDRAGHMTTVESYIVTDCPRHSPGELELWGRVSPAGGGELAELRYPNMTGRM